MTKPKTAAEIGFRCWKVRVVVPNAVLHVLSRTEPKVLIAADGRIASVDWDPVSGHNDGDTIGYVQWSAVTAVSWREAL
jgi:hypothetical protein